MFGWYILLKNHKILYNFTIILSVLVVSLLIFLPYYIKSVIFPYIDIIISISVSILSAIIILFLKDYIDNVYSLKNTFYKLYPEIIKNNDILNKFTDDCDILKNEWEKGNPIFLGESGRKWLPKTKALSFNPCNNIKYSWRYLLLHKYTTLTNDEYLNKLEILGFKIDTINLFWEYPCMCHDFCDKIQDLESEGNIYSSYIGLLKQEGKDEIIAPLMELKNNRYISPEITISISNKQCFDKINEIIERMKKNKDEFMVFFNKCYDTTKNTNPENYLYSLLSESDVSKKISLKSSHIYCDIIIIFILASIITFIVYSILKIQSYVFNGISSLLTYHWYWIVIWIIIFVGLNLVKEMLIDKTNL